MTSRNVCALGAFLFNSIARVANQRIWTVAPEAYYKVIVRKRGATKNNS
jgi:hypothetical protein